MSTQFEVFSDVSYEDRMKYNIVGTPDWIGLQLASYLPVESNATYLDPCVGHGALIKALLSVGVQQEQITACDILEANVNYCKKIYPNVRYVVRDLMLLEDTFDYVIGVPPWVKFLPDMLVHLASLANKKCVLLAPFWYGKRNYNKVNPLVSSFLIKDLDHLARLALADPIYFSASCFYEFRRDAVGLDVKLNDWIIANNLEHYFTFNPKESVPSNLVLYDKQPYFLPINPLWFYGFVKGGFTTDKIRKVTILGKFRDGKKCYGLVYNSSDEVEIARKHYMSVTVKKMLVCGTNFGWKHLRAI